MLFIVFAIYCDLKAQETFWSNGAPIVVCFTDEKPKPPTNEPAGPNDGNVADEEHNSWRRSTRNNQQDKSEFLRRIWT